MNFFPIFIPYMNSLLSAKSGSLFPGIELPVLVFLQES